MYTIKHFLESRNKAIFEAFTAPKPHKKRQKWLAEYYGLSTSRIKAIVQEQKKLQPVYKD